MSMVINTNIMSINAQNNLRTSQGDMNSAMERLSSGKRVNSAADDAAGLAIINRFTSQERGLNMAIRNANDGISMIQTAEGALDETTNILQRMRELSIQSANGIYSDANRATLQAEVSQLQDELTRIAETTSFNGLKILDGTLGDIELQVGAESGERLNVNLGSGFTAEALGTDSITAVNTGTFSLSQSVNVALDGNAGTLAALTDGQLSISGVSVPAAADYDAVSTSDSGASALGISEAINSVSDQTGVTATATTEANLGAITVSSWIDLGALAITADTSAAAAAVTTGTGTDIAATTNLSTNPISFSVTVGGTTQNVDLNDGTYVDATAATQAELLTAINADLTGITATIVSNKLVLTQDTASTPGDSITVAGSVADLTALSLNTVTATEVTDAENTLTLQAGELIINGKDMAGTYTTATDDAFVTALNAKLAGAPASAVTLAYDSTNDKVWAQTSDGSDVVITTATDFTDDEFAFTLGGTDITSAGTITGTNSGFTLGADDLTINGVDITGTVTTQDDLVALINSESADTGVTAAVTGGDLILTAADGRNIQVTTDGDISAATDLGATPVVYSAGLTLDGDVDVAGAADYVYAGVVTLNGSGFELSGENTAGFSTTETVAALSTVTADDAGFEAMTDGELSINGYDVDFTNAPADATSTLNNDASALFIAGAINGTAGLSDELTATALTVMNLGAVNAATIDSGAGAGVQAVVFEINDKSISLDQNVLADDTDGYLVSTINAALADDTAASSYGIKASLNDSNELILTAEDGRNIEVKVTTANLTAGGAVLDNVSLSTTTNVATKGTIVLEAKEGFSVGEIGGSASFDAGIVNSGQDSIADIDISTQQGAQDALAVVDRALDYIADARGDLGAASNRLEFTINNLSSVVENAAAARSRVQDTDFASESAALARAQVLQQAGTAMLAQANAAPQQVLSLLQ